MTNHFVAFSLVCLLGGSVFAAAPNKGKKLDDLLVEKSIKAETFANTGESWEKGFKEWASSAGATAGIIQTKERLQKKAGTRTGKEPASPKELLDEISAQNPAYKWAQVRGSVNVLPKDMSKGPLVVLSKPVRGFKVKERNATAAIFKLLRQNKFPVRSGSKHALGGPKPKTIPEPKDFTCDDMTVLDCVNELAKSGGQDFWQLSQDNDDGFTLTNSAEGK